MNVAASSIRKYIKIHMEVHISLLDTLVDLSSLQEENERKTQDSLERPFFSAGLGAPWDSP